MFIDYLTIALCTLLALGIWHHRRKSYKLPPGPPANLLGNAHHIPRTLHWLAFKSFADRYGPIICIWMFNHKTIVLHDYKTANALLNQRSAIYSSRPDRWMSGPLAGRDTGVFFSQTTHPRFKIYRTLLHKTLNPRALESYRTLQIRECQVLLKGLLESPEKFISHIRRNAVAISLSVAYGYQAEAENDKFTRMLEESIQLTLDLNVPGKFWVEFLPLLRFVPEWVPGAGFKRLARTLGRQLSLREEAPHDWAKAQIASGSYRESFLSDHMNDENFASTEEEREDILKFCASAIYVGGGDTSVSALTTFFLLMILHPEIQQRARDEIDRVAGSDNMVKHEDQSFLPYTKAMVKEIMRWGPVAPLGVPHQVIADDYYEGYFIPKGTRVLASIYAMTQDESIYPNPTTFDPTRFLGDNQQLDPYEFVFGFGRRICPGMHLAQSSLLLNITNILASFIISRKVGADGQELEPKVEWMSGFVSHVKPFPCQITPRSPSTLRSVLLTVENSA